jgi:hypothetical protein
VNADRLAGIQARAATDIVVALRDRGRKVSDCEAVKTTYVNGRPRFAYCGRCPMCRVWKAVERFEASDEPA